MPRRTIVMAHRGGNFGPENSLKNFRLAIEHGVEGIEFDVSDTAERLMIVLQVWLSADGVPMVLHGGDDGQLAKYGFPDEMAFTKTCE